MNIKTFQFNPFSENTYIVWADNMDAMIIDPGCSNHKEESLLMEFITDNKLKIVHHLLTHAHIDHVLGCQFVYQNFGLAPRFHILENQLYSMGPSIAIQYGMGPLQLPEVGAYINFKDLIVCGDLQFEILFTPGHSPGSICFYNRNENIIFSGDVLFEGSVGRTDLPGGNHNTLIQSIRNELLTLDPNTRVYSGHGNPTSIGVESTTNPFLI